jgi:hypothetical protein
MVKVFKPEPIGIGIGLFVIVTMYFLPLIPVGDHTVSLSRFIDLCASPVYSCSGSLVPYIFYLLWVVAIFFILASLYRDEK